MIYNKCNTPIAEWHERIVHGERGSYVEIKPEAIYWRFVRISKNQEWRVGNGMAYYLEYRTCDGCYTKIYHQKKTVKYADYKIGMLYVSVEDVTFYKWLSIKKFI